MAKTISSLSVVLGATVAPLVNAFKTAQSATSSLASNIKSVLSSAALFATGATFAAAAMSLLDRIVQAAIAPLTLAATLEQNAVAFETMTGSAAKAAALMKQLSDFAAATPFEFPELAASAKKLLAFGTDAGRIVPTLKMLGDIASGIGAPLNELAELFGKMKVQGTLYAEDINQLLGRGIPVIKEFAKQLGVSESEVKKMASEGKITFSMLEKAMQSMTGKGGQFAGMMEKQSTTLGGLWSTFTDNVSMSLAGMVQTIIDAFHLKGALAALTNAVGTVGGFLQGLVGRIAPVVMSIGSTIAGYVGGMFSDMYAVAAPVATGLANFISGAWSGIYATAVAAFSAVYNTISGALSAVWAFVSPILSGIAQAFSAAWLSVTTTAIGVFNSLYNVVSSVLSAVWEVVSTAASGIAQAWTWAMDLLGLSTMNAQSVTSGAIGGIVSAVEWIADKVTFAFNIAAFGIRNFQDIIAAAMLASAYEVVKFANQVIYFFSDVIPAYLQWFGDNWSNLLLDAANITGTVFGNMADNAGNFFTGLWSWMKGDGFNFEWKGLTEGFRSTLTELPRIAERQAGPLEQTLGDAAKSLTNDLSKGLGQYLNEQDAKTKAAAGAIKKTTDDIGKSITDAMKPKMPDLKDVVKPADMPTLDMDNTQAMASINHVKAAASDLSVVFAGSAEAAQLQAQAVFAARMAAPTATPVAPSTSQGAIAGRGQADDSWLTKDEGKTLFAKLLTEMTRAADNAGKPKVAAARG